LIGTRASAHRHEGLLREEALDGRRCRLNVGRWLRLPDDTRCRAREPRESRPDYLERLAAGYRGFGFGDRVPTLALDRAPAAPRMRRAKGGAFDLTCYDIVRVSAERTRLRPSPSGWRGLVGSARALDRLERNTRYGANRVWGAWQVEQPSLRALAACLRECQMLHWLQVDRFMVPVRTERTPFDDFASAVRRADAADILPAARCLRPLRRNETDDRR